MPVSRRKYDDLHTRYQKTITKRDTAVEEVRILGRAFDCIAVELDQAKDVIAHHIVANADTALRDALKAAGVDMRLHLADAEKKGARP
jgi:hypothetical protein